MDNLLIKYQLLKSIPIENASQWEDLSLQVTTLSELLGKFYLSELESLAGFSYIQSLLTQGTTFLKNNSYKVDKTIISFNYQNKSHSLNLYSPKELVNLLNDEWNEKEIQTFELYFANPEICVLVNVGLFLEQNSP